MRITRSATAEWKGSLKEGQGHMDLQSGAYKGPYSFQSRFESGAGTNPEELIGAAHAGCFSMALSGRLTAAGHAPQRIATTAKVNLEKLDAGWRFTGIELNTEVEATGIADADFQKLAADAKANCPVSAALSAVPITLNAKLIQK
jgi:osmotically inducible protein OsmC